ncbi:disease resistance protein RUN1 isoform X2 [Medicago truncatula]|uniref:disease resistance protein RUN1 isoform X2 n=1 Tax=Medicago truncatula TaxID=3880 RepID=UPI000D2F31DE|nr:disease resistance protein RUN1 isoform X2 [Medicago truncatula]
MNTFSNLRGPKPSTYGVFISCGDDTRFSFTGFLSHSLNNRGFYTAINHRDSIQHCRIFIFIISRDYASRLDELVNIMDLFAKGNGRQQRILPVYYHVNPSDVRHQSGSFGEALSSFYNNLLVSDFEVEKRNTVLRQVADFRGWHLDPSNDDGVCMVGICGNPGFGKTTLARGVYHFCGGIDFDCCFFFDNVGEHLMKHGLVHLQQMLLSEIVGHHAGTMFESLDIGIPSTIKHILYQMKVFLIIEDVHDSEVLRAIVELTTFFGSGSKVIITTQEKHLLEHHGIEIIYEVEKLDKKEAFQLLSLKAFKSMNFKSNYLSILERAETYASGHPFLLEVIGSNLGGKDVEECEFVLDQYEMIPNHEIQKILQVNFDALGKHCQRMLINIANQPKEQELSLVEDTLYKMYGACPKQDIRVLFDKAFIKSNELGQVKLHGLTLDMVRENSPIEYPCKHSRLQKDILEENMEYPCKRSRSSKDTLEETVEYHKQEILPSSNDGSMMRDPMEVEYQPCSSSSSQRSILHISEV